MGEYTILSPKQILSAPLRACKDIVCWAYTLGFCGCSVELPSFLDECVPQNTQFFPRSSGLRECKDIVVVGPILRFLSFHEAVGFVNVKTLLLLGLYTRILWVLRRVAFIS